MIRHAILIAVLAAGALSAAKTMAGTDNRAPAAQIIGPGIWHYWFDEEPPPEVQEFLKVRFGQDSLPLLTKVQHVMMGEDGTPVTENGAIKLQYAWAANFHWDYACRQLEKAGIPTVVALEPGPPVDLYGRAAEAWQNNPKPLGKPGDKFEQNPGKLKETSREVLAWLKQYSHNGGVMGAKENEAVIAATIRAASQLGQTVYIGGHSQFGPNFISTIARYPEVAPLLEGGEASFINPAYQAPGMQLLAHLAPDWLPLAKEKLGQPSVRQLTRTDQAAPSQYAMKLAEGVRAPTYGKYVEAVSPQVGDLLAKHNVSIRIWVSDDFLVGRRAAEGVAESLRARLYNTKEVSRMLGQLMEPGNGGVFVGGRSAGSEQPRLTKTRLSHSPRDLHEQETAHSGYPNNKIMNDFAIGPILSRGSVRTPEAIESPKHQEDVGGVYIDSSNRKIVPATQPGATTPKRQEVLAPRPSAAARHWKVTLPKEVHDHD